MGLLALSACGQSSEAPAQPAVPPPAVTVVSAEPQSVTPAQEFVGRVEAVDKVDLRARVTGFLNERRFEEGEEVEAGDLLFVIEKAPYQAIVAQRQADVASAEAQKVQTTLQLERGQELLANQNIPQAEVDQRRAQDQIAGAGILEAEAARDAAQINLGYTEIRAPIGGKIGRAAYSVGSLVGPESGPLATIVSQDPMYATFPVSVAVILDAQREAGGTLPDPDQLVVKIMLPDGSTYEQPGRINFLSNQVDRTTDTLTARAELANPDRLLVDGQFVTVRVETAAPEQALVIPQAAVQVDQAGPYVLVVTGEQTAERRRVALGPSQGTGVVVERGLEPGERVIAEGIQKVRPGMQVVAEQAPPADGAAPEAGEAAPAAEDGAP